MGRLLAVDYGLKRLGLALSDERKILASALPTLQAGKTSQETAQLIVACATKHGVEKIIVGHPLHLSGRSSFLTDEVTHFVSLLSTFTSLPIVLWDERLTSVQADRTLQLGGMNRKKRAALVDSLSAIILLQSYLDCQNPF